MFFIAAFLVIRYLLFNDMIKDKLMRQRFDYLSILLAVLGFVFGGIELHTEAKTRELNILTERLNIEKAELFDELEKLQMHCIVTAQIFPIYKRLEEISNRIESLDPSDNSSIENLFDRMISFPSWSEFTAKAGNALSSGCVSIFLADRDLRKALHPGTNYVDASKNIKIAMNKLMRINVNDSKIENMFSKYLALQRFLMKQTLKTYVIIKKSNLKSLFDSISGTREKIFEMKKYRIDRGQFVLLNYIWSCFLAVALALSIVNTMAKARVSGADSEVAPSA